MIEVNKKEELTMFKMHALVFTLLLFISASAQAGPRQDVIAGPVNGTVIDVLDGDTVSVILQVWIGQRVETSVRFAGIDTPEMKGKCQKERDMAKAAQKEVEKILSDGKIVLSNIKLEKYAGRVLATVHSESGVDVAKHLIAKGYARPYAGKKRQSWCEI